MTRTYKVELEFEVKMTYAGAPASGPSYSSGGEPAEPPEFEIESISIVGDKETVEKLYKKYKEERPNQLATPDSYDQFFADMIYNKVLDQAYEDNWDESDYPEDFDRD